LIEADVRREKRKNIIDMIAAQGILQSFMDSRPPKP
jgi:RNase H-fold protein (predicted Holliday junction resolvase)